MNFFSSGTYDFQPKYKHFSQVQFTSYVVTMNAPNVEEIYAEDIDG